MNHETRLFPWPTSTRERKTPETTAIVTVNYNTKQLVVQLLWSLYHFIKPSGFAEIVVVDNNSSDGSAEILRKLADEKLITLIENKENIYHGPALNQAVDALSKSQMENTTQPITAIWVLDSDCVVVRPDALSEAIEVMNHSHPALVGQPVVDTWNNGTFGLHSLLIDPEQVWKEPIASFEEHGQPSEHLQASCAEEGLTSAPFPFTAENYVIHLGRSTLATIADKNEKNNRYFEWATKNSAPHFAGEEKGRENYEVFQKEFLKAIPDLEIETVARAIKNESSLDSTS